jgi:hypothetical protein
MDDAERIAAATGRTPVSLASAPGHGAPSNRRWIALFGDGSTAFAKIAAYGYTAEWLRTEHSNYLALDGRAFLPRLLGWHDDGSAPTLVVEDLSSREWPPPWSAERVDAVLATLGELRAAEVPAALGPSPQRELVDPMEGWAAIRADPVDAIELGVFDLEWFSRSSGVLETAAAEAVLSGPTLVHGDVRSDNLCIRGSRAVLVDWNLACRGSDTFDLASWLPSLHHEGGPEPWTLLPGHGAVAALLAGFFLEHARRAPIPQAPHVRRLQRDQGVVALRWACHELDIPDPTDAA